MKKIKMLKTSNGAVGGLIVKTFESGNTYDVDGESIDQDLADVFVKNSIAEIVTEEVKAISPQIENKAIVPTRNKKGK